MVSERLASVAEGMIGARGWSSLGAVVGATQAHTMISLRQRLPKSIFLLPGYGTQGATAEMTRHAFRDGLGALVSASRSILYAYKDAKVAERYGTDWEQCVEGAVVEMKRDLGAMIGSL
jgi:orotidine-5'-phosphate decarboxylase